MKILGGLMVFFGVFILIGYLIAKRRLRKQNEGDTWLDKETDELSRKLDVPKSLLEITPESLNKVLKVVIILIVGGVSMILLSPS